jgi:tetratricopeptide (TPR) repeat protein
LICQVCGASNDLDQELCRKCQSKLLVVSGAAETYDEGPSGEGISLDEHLLERVSVLEEIVKRSAETLKALLEGFHRQEKNGFVIQTGLLALKDLLERKGLLVEQEFVDLWEGRVDQHLTVLEKRERFLERKERILAGHKGSGRDRLLGLLGDAELAFFALEPEKALAHLEEAWRLDRGNSELAFYLGETWFNDGEAVKAASALRHVLERAPQHFEALVYSGVLENDLGHPDKAVDFLKRALAIRPDAFLPAFALGAIHAGAGQLAKAETLLKRAVQIEENPQALSLLGTIAYERGRLTDAIDALQRAVKLDPDDEDGLFQLGLCYLDRGWTQKATERFRAALELNPNRIELQEARKLLGPAGKGALPGLPEGADRGARTGGGARDPQKVLAVCRRALKADPENPAVQIAYALVCSAVGRTAEAVSTTRRVLAQKPDEPIAAAAWATLLESLRAEGKFREGTQVAGEMLEAVTSNYARSIALFQRAAARAEMGEKLDEALEDAEKALRLSPREMRQFPLAAKGWVHYKRKEYERAVDCLSRAAELGETPTGLAHLGLAYLAVGDAKAARKAFDRAKRRGGKSSERHGGLEGRMLEQIRRNLQLTERVGSRPARRKGRNG